MSRGKPGFWLGMQRYDSFVRASRRRRWAERLAWVASMVVAYLLRNTYWDLAVLAATPAGHYLWACWAATGERRQLPVR